ncbi:hypothetical protein QCA50_006693 [Cerrena zonata]|uniref:Uncharacterized protein n=1 Tax=Cerrena zonata TaxID=2478898 RepID=A0AAW0GII4_9APHY
MLASRNASRKLLNLTRIRCARLRTTSRILKYTTNNNSTLSKEDQPSTHEPHDVFGSLDDFIRKKLDESRTIEMIANGQEVEEQSAEAQSVQTSDTVNIGSQDDVDATKLILHLNGPGRVGVMIGVKMLSLLR